jgi:hypothetical protein
MSGQWANHRKRFELCLDSIVKLFTLLSSSNNLTSDALLISPPFVRENSPPFPCSIKRVYTHRTVEEVALVLKPRPFVRLLEVVGLPVPVRIILPHYSGICLLHSKSTPNLPPKTSSLHAVETTKCWRYDMDLTFLKRALATEATRKPLSLKKKISTRDFSSVKKARHSSYYGLNAIIYHVVTSGLGIDGAVKFEIITRGLRVVTKKSER